MQYALLHRFQATLFGAVLGETIGLEYCNTLPLKPRQVFRKSQPKLQWAALTQFYTQQFLQPNRFDPVEFCEGEPMPKTTGETIVALLPVALFFHEDRLKLWQMLKQGAVWQPSTLARQESFAVGCAIADALQEKLDPLTLIPTVITYLQSLSRAETATCIDQLEQVQRLLDQQAGLETAIDRLTTTSDHDPAIGLAFYCFLSTPHDLRLALLRAAQTGASPIVGALTGAVSGAFNSMSGIPIEWQLGLDCWETPSEQIATQSHLLDLADRLLASWSGVYNPLTFSKEFRQVVAIAAPQVIRKAM